MGKRETEHKIPLEEVKWFLADREKVRKIVGSIGGKPARHERIINIIFFIVVGVVFIIALLPVRISKFLTIEIVVLLVSFKLIYFMHNEAKLNHFDSWMLSTMEWRINEIGRSLAEISKNLKELDEKIGK
jgi:hypothetical protein